MWLLPLKYKKVTGEYYEQLYGIKLETLQEIDKFLVIPNLTVINQEYIDKITNPWEKKEIEIIIKCLPPRKIPGPAAGFSTKFYKMFKEALTLIVSKLFPYIEQHGLLPLFCETSITDIKVEQKPIKNTIYLCP